MARIKTKFDKETLAHMWAAGPQAIVNHGAEIQTSTGNLYTAEVRDHGAKGGPRNDSAVWSYGSHFCLARWYVHAKTGADVILWNASGYSNTTRRQQGIVRYALRGHYSALFTVEKPNASSKREHAENLADYRARYEAAVIDAGRPRIREATRAAHLARSVSILEEGNEYAAAVGLRARLRPVDTAAITARVAREERKAAKQRAEQQAKLDAQRAEQLTEYVAAVREWQAGIRAADLLPHRFCGMPTYLRVTSKPGAHIVETTQGAQFPAADAGKLWAIVKACREQAREFVPTGLRSVTLGEYALSRVDSLGTITAGCHTVRFEQALECAQALGLES
jgi:hypothetical protein